MHQTFCVSSSCCKNTIGLRRVLAMKGKGVVLGFENGQNILIILGRMCLCWLLQFSILKATIGLLHQMVLVIECSKIKWIPLLINFKLNLLAPILKLRKLQLTSLEMLSNVLQKPIEKKHGNNPPYLAYKKKTKKQLSIFFSFHL